MKHLVIMLSLLLTLPVLADEASHGKLSIFDPFIGTWKAEVAEGTHDVSDYRYILGGKALRIMHSINNGVYGGEALVHFNTDKEAITYRYVTTASFYTEGTITPTENGFEANETVHGESGGISKTRAGYALVEDEIHVWSQFYKDEEWTDKTKAVYVRAADEEVKFANE